MTILNRLKTYRRTCAVPLRRLELEREWVYCKYPECARLGDVVQHSGGGNPAFVYELERLDERVDDLCGIYRAERAELQGLIDMLSDDGQRTVLELYYLRGLKWDEVADEKDCDRVTAWRWSKLAIENLQHFYIDMQH